MLTQLTVLASIEFISQPMKIYLRTVLDQVNQLLQNLDIAATDLNSIPSTYLARLSVTSSATANNLAIVMKKMSAGALILLLPTLVAGVFGMNMLYPGMVGGDPPTYIPFWITVSFMTLVTVFMFGLMKWRAALI